MTDIIRPRTPYELGTDHAMQHFRKGAGFIRPGRDRDLREHARFALEQAGANPYTLADSDIAKFVRGYVSVRDAHEEIWRAPIGEAYGYFTPRRSGFRPTD
jgi:hypothetical protein